jgi:RHS repeat-associated protein
MYDANGNVVSSGTDGYTWDARNHLVATPSGASFQYDPFGRRTAKTISGVTTNFLYDGLNPVQELSGGTPTANLLGGLTVDEHFLRTDSSGPANFLTDPLGSTIALADPTGTIQTQYTYEPFGNATTTGATSTNPYQFTGRENDGTGLYFNRARYYSPMFGRFISADPDGFFGGSANLYQYGRGDPIGLVDPTGTYPSWRHSQMTRDAAIDAGYTYSEADALAKAVADVDNRPGTQRPDAYDSNTHAMAGRKPNGAQQTCQQAYAGTQQQINQDIDRGDLAAALHTIEDSYSPSHFGYQPWNGGYTPLHIPGPAHMIGEDFQTPSSPDVQAATAAAESFLRAYDNYMMTGALMPTASSFLAPHPCGP